MPIFIAVLVGFWSLGSQFILNRIIFFYVANSEYVAASIISVHLLGFLLGSLAARRVRIGLPWLVGAALAMTVGAQVLLWTLGVVAFGLAATLGLALVFALAIAGLSGLLTIRLLEDRPPGSSPTPIIVADSAGSVLGAIIGGFILIPRCGLQASFALVALVQVLALLLLTRRNARKLMLGAGAALLATVLMVPGLLPAPDADTVLSVDGLPLQANNHHSRLIAEQRSPFGSLSVLENADASREMRVDNRVLCSVPPAARDREATSEWIVGRIPAEIAAQNSRHPRVAVVGLGCGMTLAAVLQALPETARVDLIEINPQIPDVQRHFRAGLPFNVDDPRAELHLRDGFAYFADLEPGVLYDAVVIDVAWMANMNATHLFSQEMYESIARHMTDRAVLGIWSEETSPVSLVSLILYRTLQSVFQNVQLDTSHDVILFLAAGADAPGLTAVLDPLSPRLLGWMAQAAVHAPINRLDDLVMNRHKFTPWGDSTFERLGDKYEEMSRALQRKAR